MATWFRASWFRASWFRRRRTDHLADSGVPAWSRDLAGDDLIITIDQLPNVRADCCCALASVCVRLPYEAGQLLFCDHHFRVHATALYHDGASAYDATGLLMAPETHPSQPAPAEAATSAQA